MLAYLAFPDLGFLGFGSFGSFGSFPTRDKSCDKNVRCKQSSNTFMQENLPFPDFGTFGALGDVGLLKHRESG